jgi:hypothetical protein
MIGPYLSQPAVRSKDLVPLVLIMQPRTHIEFEQKQEGKITMIVILAGMLWENLNARNHTEKVGIYWRVTLKWFLNK